MEFRLEPRTSIWQEVTFLDIIQAIIALSIVGASLFQLLATGQLAKGLDNALMFVMGFFFSRVKGNGYTKSVVLAFSLSVIAGAQIVGPS